MVSTIRKAIAQLKRRRKYRHNDLSDGKLRKRKGKRGRNR